MVFLIDDLILMAVEIAPENLRWFNFSHFNVSCFKTIFFATIRGWPILTDGKMIRWEEAKIKRGGPGTWARYTNYYEHKIIIYNEYVRHAYS